MGTRTATMRYEETMHPDHPDHKLKLKGETTTPFWCNGCREFGLHTRFECDEPMTSCNFHLHRACALAAFHEPTITHSFFPKCVFLFLESPESPGRHCDACARPIKGYNYHCFEKDLDLHPSCAMLPHERDEDDVKLELHEKVSSKCYKCHKKKYRNEKKSWSYVSTCGECHLHVACVKDMVREAWEKELLGDKGKAKVTDEKALVTREMPKLQIVLDKRRRKRSGKFAKYMKIVKMVLASILAAVVGDPTTMIVGLISSLSAN